METGLFIVNVVAAILIINFLVTDSSITGFSVAPEGTDIPTKFELDITSPLGLAISFVATVIVLDIYFYMKSKHSM